MTEPNPRTLACGRIRATLDALDVRWSGTRDDLVDAIIDALLVHDPTAETHALRRPEAWYLAAAWGDRQIDTLRARLAEVEAERDQKRDEAMRLYRRASDLIARLAEVEQALRNNVAALTWALGEVNCWAEEPNEADYQRACEANSAARAVLDKGRATGEERPDCGADPVIDHGDGTPDG